MLFNSKKKDLTPKQFKAEIDWLIRKIREEVSPFINDTKTKQQARMRRAREDQDYFNETYLPHYFKQDAPDFHREMEEMTETGEELGRPVAIAAPRGHAKSTRTTFARPLKKALFKEKKFIVVIGGDESLSRGMTVSIRIELEHNPRIVHDFGKQRTSTWAAGNFVTKDGTRIWARGVDQRIRGEKHGPHRADMVIIDDPEDDEMVRNPKRIKNLVNWVLEAVYPSLDPESMMLYWVGTLLSKKSALATVMDNPEWISKTFRAIDQPEWDEERREYTSGTPLWPARFNLKKLSSIRKIIGSPAFNKEYQNDPRDDEEMFQSAWIERTRFRWNQIPSGLLTTQGIDPSLKQGQSNDFKANITTSHDGPYAYCRNAWIRKASISSMVKTSYLLFQKYKSTLVGLEAEGWQELLLPDFFREAQVWGYPLPIVPIRQHGIAKVDESRIGGLSSNVENGFLRFAYGPPEEVGDMETLIEQFLAFPSPSVHDDGPDGTEFSIRVVRMRLAEPKVRRL